VLVDSLLFHQFGNYVLQRIIGAVRDQSAKTQMLESVRERQNDLLQCKHGQKVLSKLQWTYPAVFGGQRQRARRGYV